MIKILKYILSFVLLCSLAFGFPLKNIKVGDHIDFSKFESDNPNFIKSLKSDKIKLILLWRSDKNLSIRVAKQFSKLCSSEEIYCYSIDIKKGDKEKLISLIGNIPNNFFPIKFKDDPIDVFGIYTLPVTIFLDKNNSVKNAIGYEGQYLVKVKRFIALMNGKLSQAQYDKFEKSNTVVRKKSILPDLNFIKKLIRDGQREDALLRLKNLNIKDINMIEKAKLAEVYLLLNEDKKAVDILIPLSKKLIDAKFYLGVAYLKLNNLDMALKYLKGIENIYPNKNKLYFVLGKIYKEKGEYEKACSYFEMACNKNIID